MANWSIVAEVQEDVENIVLFICLKAMLVVYSPVCRCNRVM